MQDNQDETKDLQSAANEWLEFGAGERDLDLSHELEPAEPVSNEVQPVISEPVETPTEQPVSETVSNAVSQQQLALIRSLVENIEAQTRQIKNILEPYGVMPEIKLKLQTGSSAADKDSDAQVIEGVFDGQVMIGPDGHEYAVPANYASKSRLIEGDILKLVINHNGAFIFKQIQPMDRRRVTGILEEAENGDFFVMAEDRRWRVLSASVTYYKGEAGDQTVVVVPRQGMSKWAAVENIVKR